MLRARPAIPTLCLAKVFCLALGVGVAGRTAAQDSAIPSAPFLIINQEQILVGSRSGKALLAAEDQRRTMLVSEARSIDAAFEAEELELTQQRGTLPADEFHRLAEDFDRRVVAARQRQDERSDALAQELERARRQFFADVAPFLIELMDRFGASAILDENSVLLADQRMNITDAVIAEIDAAYSDAASGDDEPEKEDTGDPKP